MKLTMIIILKKVFIFKFEIIYASLQSKKTLFFGPSFINHLVFKNCRITSLLRHVPSGKYIFFISLEINCLEIAILIKFQNRNNISNWNDIFMLESLEFLNNYKIRIQPLFPSSFNWTCFLSSVPLVELVPLLELGSLVELLPLVRLIYFQLLSFSVKEGVIELERSS